MAGMVATALGGTGFGLRYLGPSGDVRNEALGSEWRTRFGAVSPVRQFPSYRGQRNFPGSWWSATLSELVGYESWVERDQLDFDRSVVGFRFAAVLADVVGRGSGAQARTGLLRPAGGRDRGGDRRPAGLADRRGRRAGVRVDPGCL